MTFDELKKEFKDSTGRWRTTNLFEETCEDPAKYPPVYSLLSESDTSSCPSLKDRYLEMRDLGEYLFANTYLGSWDHWQRICDSYRCAPYVEVWRKELQLLMRSEMLIKLKEMADGEGPQALAAARALMDELRGTKRGRPSKEEKEGAIKKAVRDSSQIQDDAARLGLKVV